MNPGTQAYWFLRENNFQRAELRKASRLPAKQMHARVRELANRMEAMGREVNAFLNKPEQEK